LSKRLALRSWRSTLSYPTVFFWGERRNKTKVTKIKSSEIFNNINENKVIS
jgi:hypothetical protein